MKTIIQWREDPNLRALALSVINDPNVKRMLDTLHFDNPANRPKAIADGAAAMFEIGMIYGYKGALKDFENLAAGLPTAREGVQETWGQVEEQEQT